MRRFPIVGRFGVHVHRHFEMHRRLGRFLHHAGNDFQGLIDLGFLALEHQLVVHLQ